jgi:hypothetical protein
MTTENTLTTLNPIHSDLKGVKEIVYDKCGFDLSNLKQNFEGVGSSATYAVDKFLDWLF